MGERNADANHRKQADLTLLTFIDKKYIQKKIQKQHDMVCRDGSVVPEDKHWIPSTHVAVHNCL